MRFRLPPAAPPTVAAVCEALSDRVVDGVYEGSDPTLVRFLVENELPLTSPLVESTGGDVPCSSAPWLRVLSVRPQGEHVHVAYAVAGDPGWALMSESAWADARAALPTHPFEFLRVVTEECVDGSTVDDSSAVTAMLGLCEAWGKDPKWLKVVGVKSGFRRDPVNPKIPGNEVVVRIRNKNYWFPADKQALDKFIRLGRKNRGEALQWFRRYVRRDRGYRGRWPDRGYVIKNTILKKNTTDVSTKVHESADPDRDARKRAFKQVVLAALDRLEKLDYPITAYFGDPQDGDRVLVLGPANRFPPYSQQKGQLADEQMLVQSEDGRRAIMLATSLYVDGQPLVPRWPKELLDPMPDLLSLLNKHARKHESRQRFIFIGSCVGLPGYAINEMKRRDTSDVVDAEDMRANCVGFDEMCVQMGYGEDLRIEDDWAVRFARSEYLGVPCYYMSHSAIEYVWTLDGRIGRESDDLDEAKLPTTMEPTPDVPNAPGYAYHGTSRLRAYDIAETGQLRTHGPSFGTDQHAWPDGKREKRSYWADDARRVYYFIPYDGAGVVLRTPLDPAVFQREAVTKDLYAKKPIPANKLEILLADGSWVPLLTWAADARTTESTAITESVKELPKGARLYHGTMEEFEGDVKRSGDGLAWFADDPRVARAYIPEHGSSVSFSIQREPDETFYPGSYYVDPNHVALLDAMGYEYSVELDKHGRIASIGLKKSPNGKFAKWGDVEAYIRNTLGYEKDEYGIYEIGTSHEGGKVKLLPAATAGRGFLHTYEVVEPLRLYDYASGHGDEGDLQDPQYNHYGVFKQAAAHGYDGVRVADFAQTTHMGNLGHISYGLNEQGLSKIRRVARKPHTRFDPPEMDDWRRKLEPTDESRIEERRTTALSQLWHYFNELAHEDESERLLRTLYLISDEHPDVVFRALSSAGVDVPVRQHPNQLNLYTKTADTSGVHDGFFARTLLSRNKETVLNWISDTVYGENPSNDAAQITGEIDDIVQGRGTDSPRVLAHPLFRFELPGTLLPADSWLIHFTNSPDAIQSKGFQYGTRMEFLDRLGLTTRFNQSSKINGTFAFAFLAHGEGAEIADGVGAGYGHSAVLFQSAGIEVYHTGDREKQVIFDGSVVRPDSIIQLRFDGVVGWYVPDVTEKRARGRERTSLEEAIEWAIRNHHQYRRVISSGYRDNSRWYGVPKRQLVRESVRWDRNAGHGHVPKQSSKELHHSHGVTTSMSPAEFLALNPPRGQLFSDRLAWVHDAMSRGEAVAPPFVVVRKADAPDGTKVWRVSTHEGRGRAMFALKQGEKSMPVDVFFLPAEPEELPLRIYADRIAADPTFSVELRDHFDTHTGLTERTDEKRLRRYEWAVTAVLRHVRSMHDRMVEVEKTVPPLEHFGGNEGERAAAVERAVSRAISREDDASSLWVGTGDLSFKTPELAKFRVESVIFETHDLPTSTRTGGHFLPLVSRGAFHSGTIVVVIPRLEGNVLPSAHLRNWMHDPKVWEVFAHELTHADDFLRSANSQTARAPGKPYQRPKVIQPAVSRHGYYNSTLEMHAYLTTALRSITRNINAAGRLLTDPDSSEAVRKSLRAYMTRMLDFKEALRSVHGYASPEWLQSLTDDNRREVIRRFSQLHRHLVTRIRRYLRAAEPASTPAS